MAYTPLPEGVVRPRRLGYHEARSMTPMQRAEHYSVMIGDCKVWAGANTHGYGKIQVHGKTWTIHDWAWHLEHEESNDLMTHLHHTCGVRGCWNLDHLVLMDAVDHCLHHGLRGFGAWNKAKTECVNGHSFDKGNTYVDRLGKRHCKICRKAALLAFHERKKATV